MTLLQKANSHLSVSVATEKKIQLFKVSDAKVEIKVHWTLPYKQMFW